MKIATVTDKINLHDYDVLVLPFWGKCLSGKEALRVSLPDHLKTLVDAALSGGLFLPESGCFYVINCFLEGQFISVLLASLGEEIQPRDVFLNFDKALKQCKVLGARRVVVLLDNVPEIAARPDICAKLCELPFLTAYNFTAYKTGEKPKVLETVDFFTEADGFDIHLTEAQACAESTLLARDLVNHPSTHMTSVQLAEEARKVGVEFGFEVDVLSRPAIEAQNMHAYLSVARGAAGDEPQLIVMRYRGKKDTETTLALVGKGILFDSGGYTLKSKMSTMHNDMGGAAAVIGAIRAAAAMELKINVVGVVAACKNMISGDAFVPGDILYSKAGKTIEIQSTDAEGRLTLADALTYAIREEKADELIDIATLTGAAREAVGNRSAVVLSNCDSLHGVLQEASRCSCEKIWRLDLDKELRPVLDSAVADLKSSNPDSPAGGRSIVAGLFLQEFVEGKPWVHIDMAPVNWLAEENPYCGKGATGYGVSLLYQFLKLKAQNYSISTQLSHPEIDSKGRK